jgi:hypothetical protein
VSVAFARALADYCVSHGVPVSWEPGWDTRGNGQTSAYQGSVTHHTATAMSVNRPSVLINGRTDLSGPLCNSAGLSNGGLHIVAAHPANHAGASGGWDTAPLPRTNVFNKLVWGHETVYEGTRPMTAEQYRTATIMAAGVCRLTGHDYDPAWGKFHQGTSITGKWDPGYALGKTYSIADFRAAMLLVMKGQHMPLTNADADLVADRLLNKAVGLRDVNDNLNGETSLVMILARLGGSLPERIWEHRMDGNWSAVARERLVGIDHVVNGLNGSVPDRFSALEKRLDSLTEAIEAIRASVTAR